MSTNKVLVLRFKLESGKKYNVRIKNADEGVDANSVQKLADLIIKQKAFDFDGKQSAYTLDGATYTTTQKKAVITAAATK